MEESQSSASMAIVVLVGLMVLLKLLNWVWLRPRRLEKFLREQGLNGNSYRFLIGDMKDIIRASKDEHLKSVKFSDNLVPHILPFYHNIILKYGKNSFFWFGPKPRLNISEPEMLKEILAKPEVFHKTHPDPGETIAGAGGLAFLEDEKWVQRRRIITPAFHMEKLKNMVPVVCECCSAMMDGWDSKFTTGETMHEIDVWHWFEDLTANVISRTAFGASSEQGIKVHILQQEQVKLVLDVLQLSFIPGWRFVPTKANRRMKAITKEIDALLMGIIEDREKALRRGDEVDDDLLKTLMESNINENRNEKKERAKSLKDIVEECKLFYFAGSETTSILLLYTMVMLSKHQDWQRLARQEVFQVIGKQEPTFDGLSRLKMVTMILHEVLRLFPPAPLTLRTAKRIVKLGSITVPAGVDLVLLIGELHHDPNIWGQDVEEFKPERFAQGVSSATKVRHSFIPFISGPRVCVGQNFALLTAKLSLAMILQRFSFQLSDSYKHAPFPILTLQPQYGAPLLFKKL